MLQARHTVEPKICRPNLTKLGITSDFFFIFITEQEQNKREKANQRLLTNCSFKRQFSLINCSFNESSHLELRTLDSLLAVNFQQLKIIHDRMFIAFVVVHY